jgi:hypothetical protein
MSIPKAPTGFVSILPAPNVEELREFATGKALPKRYNDVAPELIALMLDQMIQRQNEAYDDDRSPRSREILDDLHDAMHGFHRLWDVWLYEEAVAAGVQNKVKVDIVASAQDLEALVNEMLPKDFDKMSTDAVLASILQADPRSRLAGGPYLAHLKKAAYVKVARLRMEAEKKIDELEKEKTLGYCVAGHTSLFAKLLMDEARRRIPPAKEPPAAKEPDNSTDFAATEAHLRRLNAKFTVNYVTSGAILSVGNNITAEIHVILHDSVLVYYFRGLHYTFDRMVTMTKEEK